jgi:hypothetical protein
MLCSFGCGQSRSRIAPLELIGKTPGGRLLGILRSYEQLTDDGLLAFVV